VLLEVLLARGDELQGNELEAAVRRQHELGGIETIAFLTRESRSER
jgi:hypothetical protein